MRRFGWGWVVFGFLSGFAIVLVLVQLSDRTAASNHKTFRVELASNPSTPQVDDVETVRLEEERFIPNADLSSSALIHGTPTHQGPHQDSKPESESLKKEESKKEAIDALEKQGIVVY